MGEFKGGKVEYRTDRHANVHVPIGKASFDAEALSANYDAVVDELVRAKPSGAKGRYIRKVTLSSTMGPGVQRGPGRHRRRLTGAPDLHGPPVLSVFAPRVVSWRAQQPRNFARRRPHGAPRSIGGLKGLSARLDRWTPPTLTTDGRGRTSTHRGRPFLPSR